MTFQMQYNDLGLLLTDEDRKQIKNLPTPTIEQAIQVKKTWKNRFGDREIGKLDREGIIMGKIWYKVMKKAVDDYPELLL